MLNTANDGAAGSLKVTGLIRQLYLRGLERGDQAAYMRCRITDSYVQKRIGPHRFSHLN